MVEVKRYNYTDKSTIGRLYVDGVFECFTLELPYLDNANNVSSIPVGTYHYVKRQTEHSKYNYEHLHLKDVPNRDYILLHIGNYPIDTNGCILVGNAIGVDAVWNSKDTFDKLMCKVSADGIIIITDN